MAAIVCLLYASFCLTKSEQRTNEILRTVTLCMCIHATARVWCVAGKNNGRKRDGDGDM